MHNQETILIEAFRHRLEARFRRDRQLHALRLTLGIALTSIAIGILPLLSAMDWANRTTPSAPTESYIQR